MKPLQIILLAITITLLQSCKEGEIQVQNNITKVTIVDVKWGDIYIASELLPGESSRKITIEGSKLPTSHQISFKMTANNKSVYLETEEEFIVYEDDDKLIILTDETKVKNPNE